MANASFQHCIISVVRVPPRALSVDWLAVEIPSSISLRDCISGERARDSMFDVEELFIFIINRDYLKFLKELFVNRNLLDLDIQMECLLPEFE